VVPAGICASGVQIGVVFTNSLADSCADGKGGLRVMRKPPEKDTVSGVVWGVLNRTRAQKGLICRQPEQLLAHNLLVTEGIRTAQENNQIELVVF